MSTLDLCQYKDLKMKTCNTLHVEHFHSNVHVKESYLTPLDYARAFANTVAKNIKRLTESGFYYHTSSNSWYPPPVQTIFSSLPTLKKSKQKNIKPEESQALRDWVAQYGRCVRQRSLRQETTGKSWYVARILLYFICNPITRSGRNRQCRETTKYK